MATNVARQLDTYYVSGNYDSYATAWRYLGTYLDCSSRRSLTSYRNSGMTNYYWRKNNKNNNNNNNNNNSNNNNGGSSSGSSSGCARKLLWAAYYDPNYGGGEIGEYQFYANGQWDTSTCQSSRCAKMDCHDPYSSNWELIGVYKESVSFEDDTWFEQLFKHEGYCLWDGDKEDSSYSDYTSSSYQFMQAMREELPSGCTQVNVFKAYGYGSSYYIDIKPQQNGKMTIGVYTDSSCQKEASYTFSDYQKYLSNKATGTSGAFDTWNSLMNSYKICQPCRAYNRQQTYRRDRERDLAEQNDGQGDEESHGYNCYDDAGYQNCNQCFKFETHTDMEEASASDLSTASSQGTILKINYGGSWYGSGTVGDVQSYSSSSSSSSGSYSSSSSSSSSSKSSSSKYSSSSSTAYSFAGGAAFLVFGFALWGVRKVTRRRIVLESGEGAMPSTTTTTTSPPLV